MKQHRTTQPAAGTPATSPASSQSSASSDVLGNSFRQELAAEDAFPFQAEMEGVFGADFSELEVSTGDPRPSALGALAYFDGSEMVFSDASPDKRLVARELVHAEQSGPGTSTDAVEHWSHPAEEESRRLGDQAAAGSPVQVTGARGPGIHREADLAALEEEEGGVDYAWLCAETRLVSDVETLQWFVRRGQQEFNALGFYEVDFDEEAEMYEQLELLDAWMPVVRAFHLSVGLPPREWISGETIEAIRTVREAPHLLVAESEELLRWYVTEGLLLLAPLGINGEPPGSLTDPEELDLLRYDVKRFQRLAAVEVTGRITETTRTLITGLAQHSDGERTRALPSQGKEILDDAYYEGWVWNEKPLDERQAIADQVNSLGMPEPLWGMVRDELRITGSEVGPGDVPKIAELQHTWKLMPTGVPDNTFFEFARQNFAPDLADPSIEGVTGDNAKAEPGTLRRMVGSVFVNGVSAGDIQQGLIGDCAMVSALAAAAQQDPGTVTSMFRDNGDGTYAVRYYAKGDDGTYKAYWYRVDTDFYDGFAQSNEWEEGMGLELWPLLAEKAAAMHFSQHPLELDDGEGFAAISGGDAHRLSAVLGRDTQMIQTGDMMMEDDDAAFADKGVAVFGQILTALEEGRSVMCGAPYAWGSASTSKEIEIPAPQMSEWMWSCFVDGTLVDDAFCEKTRRSIVSLFDFKMANKASERNHRVPALRMFKENVLEHRSVMLDWVDNYFRKGKVFDPGVMDSFDWWREDHAEKQALEIEAYTRSLLIHLKTLQIDRAIVGAESGLVTKHAYAIIDAFTVGDEHFVKVFNPHNKNEGGLEGLSTDGKFIMNIKEFMCCFDEVGIC